ncbi:hypothetical protein AVEN_135546-1 [Araneus ventricosus]|uniref:Uncharacterized protein n=1 Tax=Araneus ventricosus TaxID=182803 RepID=A0A4Y2PKQ8_ARAVE|nr:hypothetical protein AVEN_135546-1 [Araneus ventricosus]
MTHICLTPFCVISSKSGSLLNPLLNSTFAETEKKEKLNMTSRSHLHNVTLSLTLQPAGTLKVVSDDYSKTGYVVQKVVLRLLL